MAEKLQTITELHRHVSNLLSALWPKAEAEAMAALIIGEYTGMGRAHQLAYGDHPADTDAVARILAAANRAVRGEPLQYIFGYTLFRGHRIEVEPGVLIPRPETEEMTSLAIAENNGFRGVATDLCTGSGCIAIALSLSFPVAEVFAADYSASALKTAARNIESNGASVKLLKIDILNQPSETVPLSNLIISNPPYVTESEKRSMHVNVVDYEPPESLFVPDSDPLLFYRHLERIADSRLVAGGTIYLEVNESYAEAATRLFSPKIYREIKVLKDFRERDRFVKAVKNG
jgi:release factor glutamine methyltransferase